MMDDIGIVHETVCRQSVPGVRSRRGACRHRGLYQERPGGALVRSRVARRRARPGLAGRWRSDDDASTDARRAQCGD